MHLRIYLINSLDGKYGDWLRYPHASMIPAVCHTALTYCPGKSTVRLVASLAETRAANDAVLANEQLITGHWVSGRDLGLWRRRRVLPNWQIAVQS